MINSEADKEQVIGLHISNPSAFIFGWLISKDYK
jgi:hypothetical protein